MKIANDEMAGLLAKMPTTRIAKQPEQTLKVRQVRSGREVARANELKCLKAVAQFGHLRIVELARCVWPTAVYGEQVARRTVARMVEQGLLLERRNALGSKSLCLTRGGAAWLDARGIQAQHTLDLSSVAGPTFFHRTLATRYLIERQVAGQQVAGEYQILRRKLPFSIEGLAKALHKLPDGLVWQRKSDGTVAVEIVEQEAAAKARSELEKCLKAAEYVGSSLSKDGTVKIAGLVFVYDRSLNHARRILLAASLMWQGRTSAERAALESRVKLVAVELREPLVWVSSSVITLHEFRGRGV